MNKFRHTAIEDEVICIPDIDNRTGWEGQADSFENKGGNDVTYSAGQANGDCGFFPNFRNFTGWCKPVILLLV